MCGRVISTCRDIISSFQDAPRVLSSIQTECSTTREALSHIFMLINRTESIALADLSSNTLLSQSFNIALTGCTITFSALDIELEKILGSSENGKTLGLHERAKFIWKEDVLNAVMEELRGQRDALNLLVSVVQRYLSYNWTIVTLNPYTMLSQSFYCRDSGLTEVQKCHLSRCKAQDRFSTWAYNKQ